MNSASLWQSVRDPLVRKNPVTLQILGICSALAVTTSLVTALTMSAALTTVLVLSAALVSLVRHHLPDTVRLIVQIVIVASLVIVIDQVLQAFLPRVSRSLSVYVSLITTNCLVLGRTEGYARYHPPLPAMADALGNGLGYSLVLIVIGGLRELFGRGQLFEFQVLPLAENGGWFTPLPLMLLAPSAFFMLGLLVWCLRSMMPEQVEAPLTTAPVTGGAER
ncbi:NADH:ubiquinone reductase (Na(+)-transporting) subunit D [Roseivivax sp. CAU 1761]